MGYLPPGRGKNPFTANRLKFDVVTWKCDRVDYGASVPDTAAPTQIETKMKALPEAAGVKGISKLESELIKYRNWIEPR